MKALRPGFRPARFFFRLFPAFFRLPAGAAGKSRAPAVEMRRKFGYIQRGETGKGGKAVEEKHLILGLLAHVDAGKTTLSEAML